MWQSLALRPALLAELMKLKLFVVEHSDDGTMLVPPELATTKAEPAKVKLVSIAAKVTPDFAAQVRALSDRRGETVSSVIVAALTEYIAAHPDHIRALRAPSGRGDQER